MAALSTQNIIRGGLQASYTAVAASHTYTNDTDYRTFFHIVNGATPMTVTIVTSQTVDGLAVSDRTVSVGASEEHFIGPFGTTAYGSTVTVQFSDTTDGTMAVLRVPNE